MGIFNSTYSREDFEEHAEKFKTNNKKYKNYVKHVLNNKCFENSLNVLSEETIDEYDKLLKKCVIIIEASVKIDELCTSESQTWTNQTEGIIACNKKLEKIIEDLEKAIKKDTDNVLNGHHRI